MRGPSGCHGRGDRLPLRARAVAAFGGQAAWQAPPPPTRRPDDVSVGERQGEWRRPVGWGRGGGGRDGGGPRRGRVPLQPPPARVAPRAPAHHPGGHPCGPRPASHPPPGLAVDGRPLLPRRPWGRRLGEERPPRIHWTRVPRQVAEAGRPDVRTRLSPNGPPMMDRGLVDIHQPSRGAATPTVRQRGGPAPRRGGLGAEARRGGTPARGDHPPAAVTVPPRRAPRPAPGPHPPWRGALSPPPTRRVATGAWPVVHRGR